MIQEGRNSIGTSLAAYFMSELGKAQHVAKDDRTGSI
jgi:hypothetical protein